MRVELIKQYDEKEIASRIANIQSRYGGLGELQQRVEAAKCKAPDFLDNYMVLRALKSGASLERKVVINMYDFFKVLTPRRVELLSYLLANWGNITSIRALSNTLRRNYKNVYNDLVALARFDLISFVRKGKNSIPLPSADKIVIHLR